MLLIAQIILVIFVWKKGWNWKSLIPIGLSVLFGIILGIMVGTGSTTMSDIQPITITGDVLATIALLIMLVNPPKNLPKNENQELQK